MLHTDFVLAFQLGLAMLLRMGVAPVECCVTMEDPGSVPQLCDFIRNREDKRKEFAWGTLISL